MDGIRGIAALVIVLFHTTSIGTYIGPVSVFVFFELSGFLILGILATSRTMIESGESTRSGELKHFWTNRLIRIGPVYYAALFGIAPIGLATGQFHAFLLHLPWYVTYTQNFFFADVANKPDIFVHTWSLATEQQFYILFGLLFVLIPRRHHLRTLTGITLICLIGLAVLEIAQVHSRTLYGLPFSGFVFICAGGTLALLAPKIANVLKPFGPRLCEGLNWTVLGIIAVLALMPADDAVWSRCLPIPRSVVMVLLSVLIFTFLLLVVSYPRLSVVKVLEHRAFTFLGSISYALYVVHLPIATMTKMALNKFHSVPAGSLFVLTLLLSIALSTASRRFIERPMAKLRAHRGPIQPPIHVPA